MKTLLLYVQNQDFAFNTSVAALAGVARDAGVEYAAYGISDGQSVDDVVEQVVAHDPQLVCATFMTRDIMGFRSLFPRLRQRTEARIAVGGYHVTARPRQVAEWAGVDAICIGEGERPLRALLHGGARRQPIDPIPGLWVRGANGFVGAPPPADAEPSIEALPLWDYAVFADPLVPGEDGRTYLVTRTSRACPFACTYCTVPLWEDTNGLRQRHFTNTRPVAHLCAELAALRDRYRPSDIEFWDPQFRFASDWLEEFSERYPAEVGLPFRVLMHAKTLNQQRIAHLAKAGCTQIYCGIESGDFDFRKHVLNKACTDDDIVRTTAWVQAAGIKASAFVMWNMPGESREQAEKTIAMVERIGFDQVRINSYIPLPGTSLGDALRREFPEEPVATFEPLPEWRMSAERNWSAMSDDEHRLMAREFRALHNRYSEQQRGPTDAAGGAASGAPSSAPTLSAGREPRA